MSVPSSRFGRKFLPLVLPLMGRRAAPPPQTLVLVDPAARQIARVSWDGGRETLRALLGVVPAAVAAAAGAELLTVRLHILPAPGPHLLVTLAANQGVPALAGFELLPHAGLFGGRALLGTVGGEGVLTATPVSPERVARHVRWQPAADFADADGDDAVATALSLEALIQQVDGVLAGRPRGER